MNRQKEYNKCDSQKACSECSLDTFCKAWVNFVLSHNDKKSYAHFDKQVSLAMPSIRQYVMDRKKVAVHSFYPFIHFEKKSSRYGKKGPKNPRQLYYCSHLDRCVYQRYAFLLNQKYNKRIKNTAINSAAVAYRDNLGKNNIDFAKVAFEKIKSQKHCMVIIGDFTGFFDNLDHQYLKEMLCNLLDVERIPRDYYAVFKNITRFASWDWKLLVEQSGHSITERGIRTKLNNQNIILSKMQFEQHKASIIKNNSSKGIPQGSPISAVLSNIYMLQFDKAVSDYVLEHSGTYMRYSDDFLVVIPYKNGQEIPEHENWIFSQVNKIKGLELQEEKTAVYIYDNGSIVNYLSNQLSTIDYLGFVFDGSDVKLRPKSITKYYYRMRRKARTIGRSHWQSPKGKHISAQKLYDIYASGGEHQTFIDYAKRAKGILKLNDREADSLIKYHKRKIANAIKSVEKEQKRTINK